MTKWRVFLLSFSCSVCGAVSLAAGPEWKIPAEQSRNLDRADTWVRAYLNWTFDLEHQADLMSQLRDIGHAWQVEDDELARRLDQIEIVARDIRGSPAFANSSDATRLRAE